MKKFALALVVLALVGGAFGGGYFLHHWQGPNNTERMSETASTPLQKSKAKAPPEWTEWQYPGSKEQGSSKGGGGLMNGVKVGPIYSVELTTSDDLDKVLNWYAKEFGSEIIAVPTGSGSLSRFNSDNKDDPVINGNVILSNRPSDDRNAGSLRPVKMKVISVRTPRYDLVVNVSRAESESHTHVVVTYFPNLPSE
jgi:hypothetical protein